MVIINSFVFFVVISRIICLVYHVDFSSKQIKTAIVVVKRDILVVLEEKERVYKITEIKVIMKEHKIVISDFFVEHLELSVVRWILDLEHFTADYFRRHYFVNYNSRLAVYLGNAISNKEGISVSAVCNFRVEVVVKPTVNLVTNVRGSSVDRL